MLIIIIIHFTTQKGGNQHEISRIASKVYTFPTFHTADNDLNLETIPYDWFPFVSAWGTTSEGFFL